MYKIAIALGTLVVAGWFAAQRGEPTSEATTSQDVVQLEALRMYLTVRGHSLGRVRAMTICPDAVSIPVTATALEDAVDTLIVDRECRPRNFAGQSMRETDMQLLSLQVSDSLVVFVSLVMSGEMHWRETASLRRNPISAPTLTTLLIEGFGVD